MNEQIKVKFWLLLSQSDLLQVPGLLYRNNLAGLVSSVMIIQHIRKSNLRKKEFL